jgi:hypothetical protein
MSPNDIDIDVEARYKLCEGCLNKEYRPGGAHSLSVILKRILLADSKTKWLNPFFIEKHSLLEQPYREEVCDHCPFREEHEMHNFVSNL